MRFLYFTFICILFLSACSSRSKPDSISENVDGVTATKQVEKSDFEIRLFVNKVNSDDNTFELEAAVCYTGNRSEITINHGEPIGDPAVIQTIGLSTSLKASEWLTQDITLPSPRTQIKSFYENDGKITLHAYFDAEGYEHGVGEYLSLTAEEIPR